MEGTAGDKQVCVMNDEELLQRYAREGSQEAFAEIVGRHVSMVHSAALRQVRSHAWAADVTQSVFVALASSASTMNPGAPLVAWLYTVTRRKSVDLLRRESRRRAHEGAAAALAAIDIAPNSWERIAGTLDEAMHALRAGDRHLLLLRYFENWSLEQIGAACAISEPAAEKRLERALDRLRASLSRRGVRLASAALGNQIAARAVESAPAGLAVKTLAEAAIARTAPSLAAHTLMATAVNKLGIAAATIAAGAAVATTTLLVSQQIEIHALRLREADLQREAGAAAAEVREAATRMNAAESQVNQTQGSPIPGSDASIVAEMQAWTARVERLKRAMARSKGARLPQLAYLSDQDWFDAASAPLDSETAMRRELSAIRSKANMVADAAVRQALDGYLRAHAGSPPQSPLELAPYLAAGAPAGLLDEYEMVDPGSGGAGPASGGNGMQPLMAMQMPVDVEYDSYTQITANGFISSPALNYDIDQARRAFTSANNGLAATDAAQLIPYLIWPVDPEVLQAKIASRGKGSRL